MVNENTTMANLGLPTNVLGPVFGIEKSRYLYEREPCQSWEKDRSEEAATLFNEVREKAMNVAIEAYFLFHHIRVVNELETGFRVYIEEQVTPEQFYYDLNIETSSLRDPFAYFIDLEGNCVTSSRAENIDEMVRLEHSYDLNGEPITRLVKNREAINAFMNEERKLALHHLGVIAKTFDLNVIFKHPKPTPNDINQESARLIEAMIIPELLAEQADHVPISPSAPRI